MNEKKREGTFIPCGDSMEKMEEIRDDALENVSGGNAVIQQIIWSEWRECPVCGNKSLSAIPSGDGKKHCTECGYQEA